MRVYKGQGLRVRVFRFLQNEEVSGFRVQFCWVLGVQSLGFGFEETFFKDLAFSGRTVAITAFAVATLKHTFCADLLPLFP